MKSVYVMKSNGSFKIGVSKNPQKRLSDLAIGNSNINLIYESRKLSNSYEIEKKLHKMLSGYSIGREWFAADDELALLKTVEMIVAKHGRMDMPSSDVDEKMLVKDEDEIFELSDWLAKQEAEIAEIARESEAMRELVCVLVENPKLSNVVSGLVDCGWEYTQIKSFIEQNNMRRLAA